MAHGDDSLEEGGGREIIFIDMLKVSWSLATIDSHSDTR